MNSTMGSGRFNQYEDARTFQRKMEAAGYHTTLRTIAGKFIVVYWD